MPPKVIMLEHSPGMVGGIVDSLSLCRDAKCNEDTLDYCMKALPVQHLSALEMCWFKFRVEGLSVKSRIQLERHRLFGSMERSTRHINMSDAEFIIPPTAKEPKLYERLYDISRRMYIDLLDAGEDEENAAYLLPLGVTTKFDLVGNGRVFFEYFTKRLCLKEVQHEHFLFAMELYKQTRKVLPVMEYAVPCRWCKKC